MTDPTQWDSERERPTTTAYLRFDIEPAPGIEAGVNLPGGHAEGVLFLARLIIQLVTAAGVGPLALYLLYTLGQAEIPLWAGITTSIVSTAAVLICIWFMRHLPRPGRTPRRRR